MSFTLPEMLGAVTLAATVTAGAVRLLATSWLRAQEERWEKAEQAQQQAQRDVRRIDGAVLELRVLQGQLRRDLDDVKTNVRTDIHDLAEKVDTLMGMVSGLAERLARVEGLAERLAREEGR